MTSSPEDKIDEVSAPDNQRDGSIRDGELALATEDIETSGFDLQATKRLLWKIDRNLLPLITLLYLLNFLDRTNIGNARLANLEEDLGMKGLDYNIVLAVFYPLYILAEIPSNLALKRWRPSIWIPSLMIAWGIVCTLMGIVRNFPGLLIARCALGIAEAGVFPGINYYITLWYRRKECGLRMALFFSAATAAGAFGGLLARALVEMDGVGGLSGWSWIFILEGIATVVVAIFAFFLLHDYPSTARFLTPKERNEVVRRLKHDRSILPDEFDLKYVKHALKDWKIWVHMFITFGIYTAVYSYALFTPTIVKNLGYTNERAQLMSAPPYVLACFFCIICGYCADRLGQRGIYIICTCALAIVGYAILMISQNNHVKYFACFVVAAGIYPNVPQGVAWNGNNIGGSIKRGVGIAMHVGFGNLGGILASFVYRDDGPRFLSGHGLLLGLVTMSMVLCIFMRSYLVRENARRDREYKKPEEYTVAEMVRDREMGDDAPYFRYVV